MSDLKDLYQEAILDHYKNPRNFHRLEQANRQANGYNPLCGDKLSIYIQIENNIVKNISFIGSGCAISTASASLMTDNLKGKTIAEAINLFERFQQMLAISANSQPNTADLGNLSAFSSVREYPVRVKCVTLAWHAMRAALEGFKGTVETE